MLLFIRPNSMISPPPAPDAIATAQDPVAPMAGTEGQQAEQGQGQGPEEEQGEKGLSPTMYDKLRAEATAPFRSFRMFIYGGFGVGAGVGGFTAVTQLIKSVQGYVSV
jgi:hypothetical protein